MYIKSERKWGWADVNTNQFFGSPANADWEGRRPAVYISQESADAVRRKARDRRLKKSAERAERKIEKRTGVPKFSKPQTIPED